MTEKEFNNLDKHGKFTLLQEIFKRNKSIKYEDDIVIFFDKVFANKQEIERFLQSIQKKVCKNELLQIKSGKHTAFFDFLKSRGLLTSNFFVDVDSLTIENIENGNILSFNAFSQYENFIAMDTADKYAKYLIEYNDGILLNSIQNEIVESL